MFIFTDHGFNLSTMRLKQIDKMSTLFIRKLLMLSFRKFQGRKTPMGILCVVDKNSEDHL